MTDPSQLSKPETDGPLSEADVLEAIGGWRVGCEIAVENSQQIARFDGAGFLSIRRHYAPATPEGDPAYELTTQGLRRLALIGTPEQFRDAVNKRDWYRANTSIPAQQQSSDDGVEVRHATTGNKAGSIPEEAGYPSATRFVREEVRGSAIQTCAGVTPGSSEALSPQDAPAQTTSSGLRDRGERKTILMYEDALGRIITEDREEHTNADGPCAKIAREAIAKSAAVPPQESADLLEEAAGLIWAELCPGMVMGADDSFHYRNAARAVLALLRSQEVTTVSREAELTAALDEAFGPPEGLTMEQAMAWLRQHAKGFAAGRKFEREMRGPVAPQERTEQERAIRETVQMFMAQLTVEQGGAALNGNITVRKQPLPASLYDKMLAIGNGFQILHSQEAPAPHDSAPVCRNCGDENKDFPASEFCGMCREMGCEDRPAPEASDAREAVARMLVPYWLGGFERQERNERGHWEYPPYTPNARAYEIADKALAIIAARHSQEAKAEINEETLADFIGNAEERLGPGCDEQAIAQAILADFDVRAKR